MNLKNVGVTEVSQCLCVSHIFHVPIGIFIFLSFLCHRVTLSQCDTLHGCHTCATCHTCHIYHCHVSLDIKSVIRGLLVSDFNEVEGVGESCLPKAKRQIWPCFWNELKLFSGRHCFFFTFINCIFA
jgi:hypothetical protein